MNPLFSVGEVVILQSKSRPEFNGEYTVRAVVRYGEKYTCRVSGDVIPFAPINGSPLGYVLEEVIVTVNIFPGEIENTWAEGALRKRHTKGNMSFKELMSDLKTNIQERVV